MRILVTGSRNFADTKLMREVLSSIQNSNVTLIHGGCRGADKIAEEIGEELGFQIEEHLAEWNKYGKSAGPIRNAEMLNSRIDLVLAFPVEKSKGTKDCISKALQKNIPVLRIERENRGKEKC